MNHQQLLLIWSAVQSDIDKGKVIDVDAVCQTFAQSCPDLTRKQIQDVVLEVVSMYGGGAVWGSAMSQYSSPKRG